MANIKARRRLSDLFKVGTEIRFGERDGEPWGQVGPFLKVGEEGQKTSERLAPREDDVIMFIMPPDPLQREMAMRDASAKRAAAIVRAKRDKDSEEHLTIMAFLADMDDATLLDYVLLGDTTMRRAQAEREILATDEWKNISDYQEAMRRFDEMSDQERAEHQAEWDGLMELDQKYIDQINDRELELRAAQHEVLQMQLAHDRGGVEKQALDKRSELSATQAFIREYEIQMMFFSCREWPDTSTLFFESTDELARQPPLVRDLINEALIPYISDAGEAKNSPGAADGSEPSEPPRKPETSEPSIPEMQTV